MIGQELPVRVCHEDYATGRKHCGTEMLVPVACTGGNGAPRGYMVAHKGERYIVPSGQVRRAMIGREAILESFADGGACDVAAEMMRSGTEPPSVAFDACPTLIEVGPAPEVPEWDIAEIEATGASTARNDARPAQVYIPSLRVYGTLERWLSRNAAEIRYGDPTQGYQRRAFDRSEFEAL